MAGFHPIGQALEWLFEKLAHVEHLSPGALYRYAIHKHTGRPMIFSDGTAVHPGDTVIELHLDNERVRQLVEESGGAGRRFAVAFLHAGRTGLVEVAELVDRSLPQVNAVFANTPGRFAPIADGLGYERRELDGGLRTRMIGRIQRGVLKRFDPEGYQRIHASSEALMPVEVWMSRRTLMSRYLRQTKHCTAGGRTRVPPNGS